MKIKLYGVRGSISAPLSNSAYMEKIVELLERAVDSNLSSKDQIDSFIQDLPEHIKYVVGGDTTCISVWSDAGKQYVVDCGTGGRVLGDEMMRTDFGKGKGVLEFFITHTHWDHIQGLPFFKPVYIPGNQINFRSPYHDLETRLVNQQVKEFFPMPFHGTASKKQFFDIRPGDVIEFEDGMKVSCHPLKHPGGSYAYKFEEKGRKFIFATDAEYTGADMGLVKELTPFFGGADVLVLDSQYTLDESFAKFDWGHTSYTMAVNCATIWGIKTLVLTHHEPAYNDRKVFEILEEAVEHKRNLGGNPLELILAREGLILEL
ncbi:MAG TPA: MBL fold metallo-hydrolase [Leptospiraceae bacterium]|nr:MBL fold metallo-hydrolase [Leptospiraceae bacterium]HMY66494.1 MBL fold metallo-hydrolase [Leptospiraceae bacterium]HNF13620.1 MBL fold metallo-hydrolase [Leptospiraceae bacterium]HNF27541.1 MBL fold metallo-hydrolase [Leptospiraceae bacterium]HNI98885.1 MBL fold metallo-hydrolase [Leptospiraceae bacterium]